MSESKSSILQITAEIVAAHLGNNQVDTSAVPSVIRSVYLALSNVDASEPKSVIAPQPAVSVKKSIFPDFIICLEDGKKLKLLKRHLQTSYGMTPDDYRKKWGLPRNYPMTAPNYAITRSKLASQIGLGKRVQTEAVEPEIEQLENPQITVLKARRARGSKR